MTRTTGLTKITRALGALGIAGAIAVLPACGGDDDGAGGAASGGRLSDEAFCELVDQRFAALEAADPDEYEAELFGLVGSLASQAPTAELSSAMEKMGELGEVMAGIDEDDPEAFGEVFAMMMDPSFSGAMETLDDFFTNTCGMDD